MEVLTVSDNGAKFPKILRFNAAFGGGECLFCVRERDKRVNFRVWEEGERENEIMLQCLELLYDD